MSLKEFTARSSAIILITASAYGIALAADLPPPKNTAPDGVIKAQTPAGDNAISGRVQIALTANNIRGLEIQTELGIVTLRGTVANEEVRRKAAHIAAAVEGVQSVDITALKTKSQA